MDGSDQGLTRKMDCARSDDVLTARTAAFAIELQALHHDLVLSGQPGVRGRIRCGVKVLCRFVELRGLRRQYLRRNEDKRRDTHSE